LHFGLDSVDSLLECLDLRVALNNFSFQLANHEDRMLQKPQISDLIRDPLPAKNTVNDFGLNEQQRELNIDVDDVVIFKDCYGVQ